MSKYLHDYLPGIILFLVALVVGILVFQDYGISWDEPLQRYPGLLSYNYMFSGDKELLHVPNDYHGAGFEVLLMLFEKNLHLTDTRDIYLMRHLVTHVFFILSALSLYVLVFRLYDSKFLACAAFIMLVMAPRMYAHSFFNSKDIPFLSMALITLTVCRAAFANDKAGWFILLGVACGYTTSIRIMGIMFFAFIVLLFVIDAVVNGIGHTLQKKLFLNLFLFVVGFCVSVYISWPYLWHAPLQVFIQSFKELSHYNMGDATVLFNGRHEPVAALPWTYPLGWLCISTPVVWVVAGFAGMGWIVVDSARRPAAFIRNNKDRNFLLHVACFIAPVLAVILMHSVLYDDWRHLYFVYPAFVLMAVYFLDKLLKTRFGLVIQSAMVIQMVITGYNMVQVHPFQQVYFNGLVPHGDEYLRNHYDMEYWGASYKQALEYLLVKHPEGTIKVSSNFLGYEPIKNNVMLLPQQQRARIECVTPENADYFITNFRNHTDAFPYPRVEYTKKVLNSTIMCIYRVHE